MKTIKTMWEDEEHNRQVHFSVQYDLKNDSIEITNITPEKVTFVCPENNTVERSIGVHTTKGKDMLAKCLLEARGEQLKAQIAEKEAAKFDTICV